MRALVSGAGYNRAMTTKSVIVLVSLLIIPGIGLLDLVSGDELSLIVLYLAPISNACWFGGIRWGTLAGLLALASWTLANIAFPARVDLDPTFQHSWELIEKVIFFALAVAATARLRKLVLAERRKGLTDFATGLPNRRAFAADLSAAQAQGGALEIGFMDLDGLEALALDRGEAYIESVIKAAAEVARAQLRTYRFGDERLAFIAKSKPGSESVESMRSLAVAIEKGALAAKAPSVSLKIGIARCRECAPIAPQALRKFLEGGMTFLRSRSGVQVEAFDFPLS
jgi:GGDEF domain-containing protein